MTLPPAAPPTATCLVRSRLARAAVVLVGVTVTLAAGCAPTKPAATTPKPAPDRRGGAPITNTDPCAMRLHDVSGAFLLYYAVNERLPETLGQLRDAPGSEDLPQLVCPVSGEPYVYTPDGILMLDRKSRIILFDPAPSHSGYRWAVSIVDPVPGQPLQTRVIAVPESFFLLR